MNVGDASRYSGLPVKTIRYYDDIGLVSPARRDNGYRAYDDKDVKKLQFLKRARHLGFSIDDCRELLSLYEDTSRASADVKEIAETHLGAIDLRIEHLKSLRDVLSHLVQTCHGDERPDCPILNDLSGDGRNAVH